MSNTRPDSSVPVTPEGLAAALAAAREALLAGAGPQCYWAGCLSSSALSTAVAAFALARAGSPEHRVRVDGGLAWLAAHASADGGWGDTPESPSNLSTTLVVWSALSAGAPGDVALSAAEQSARDWVRQHVGSLTPEALAAAVLGQDGGDRTSSASVLAACALAGRLGPEPDAWRLVPQLPLEWALAPRAALRRLRLPVASYAIAALIAIGLLRHRREPSVRRMPAALRRLVAPCLLRRLAALQPANGGFLETVPLTGFVALALAGAGEAENAVAQRAAGFLAASARTDGSWPLDTNLATRVTSLAINALGVSGGLPAAQGAMLRRWLLAQQFRAKHPITGAAAGGWAWTDRPGGVPDADDTAGVLLALRVLGPADDASRHAASEGVRWLCALQNGDGGLPVFCRGWGWLPSDRSGPDLTAHALRALDAWYDEMPARLRPRIDMTMERGMEYLDAAAADDGSWTPMGFGNENAPGRANPVCGTAQVLIALREITPDRLPQPDDLVRNGAAWLMESQNEDGGWGGAPGVDSSIEETALAVRALAGADGECEAAALRGAGWLVASTEGGCVFKESPLGLRPDGLSYSERLYPIVFTVGALGRLCPAWRLAPRGRTLRAWRRIGGDCRDGLVPT